MGGLESNVERVPGTQSKSQKLPQELEPSVKENSLRFLEDLVCFLSPVFLLGDQRIA
jgi:hypothetical protein